MPQYEYVPQQYELDSSKEPLEGAVHLRCIEPDYPFQFSFQPLRQNIFRATFSSTEHPLPPHPSVACPKVDSQSLTDLAVQSGQKECTWELGDVRAEADWENSAPVITIKWTNSEKPLHQDLPFRSYAVDGTGIAHYTRYTRNTLHVGLGEKAAPMDLSNRHFILAATDCFGYDVYRTDPLYKHIPLLINATPEGCVGIFSASHARGSYAIGSEIDGLWGHFKVYRQDHGGLDEYIIVGRTLRDVVKSYADIAGYPLLVPRWAFGYIAGGMKYSMLDEPRACDALLDFADKLKEHDIPCSAFQLSSGYTVAEKPPMTRNVFTWNRRRFPDPKRFIDAYHSRGIRLIANVKPYVLENHPEYRELADAGALFTDPRSKNPAVARLWSAGGGESSIGSHIDFTSAAGFQWWYEGVKSLKALGIDSIWNDNNEYTIPNDNWRCVLDNEHVSVPEGHQFLQSKNNIGLWGRALHTELMAKSSHDALAEMEPDSRPFVLTRSATAGTMRYAASSWSGDNVTSWEGMRGSNALSLTAGMCLLQCYGHDIGGFEGSQPTPELLLRWVQLGIYSSRFAINCFKTSPENNNVGDVIEPWMYPDIIPNIRDAIKRRYELIPYIYSLALESHMTASPPQRWIGWRYEADPVVWTPFLMKGETQYWLGDSLLIGGVYEPGATAAKIYLPKKDEDDCGYLHLNSPYEYLPAGQWVEIESRWDSSIPVLAKVGGAVPVGRNVQTRSPGDKNNPANLPSDDYRAVEIFPPKGSSDGRSFTNTWYEDDGVSSNTKISSYTITYSSTAMEVTVKLEKNEESGFRPLWTEVAIILPVGDIRSVIREDGNAAEEVAKV
ncbi:glycoside hydrolase family 31 protein [Lipomyces starkeyi]